MCGAGVFAVTDRVACMLGHALYAEERTTFEAKQVQRLSHVQLTQIHDDTVRLIIYL